MTSVRNSPPIATGNEGLNCFVCDAVVVGTYFTLASCRTKKTKVRLIEKLGQLVGDQYMVVISEDDVICRTCTSMMNNLDRLERELYSVRTIVLKFLEKKYELEEGELVNAKVTYPGQKLINNQSLRRPMSSDILSRKRKAAALESDDVELVNGTENNKGTKKNLWLQCDKCKYKTPYNSFMVNHIQRHTPQNTNDTTTTGTDTVTTATNEKDKLNVLNEPPPPVSKPADTEPVVHKPETEIEPQVEPENSTDNLNTTNVTGETEEPAEPETVEMVAAEIDDLAVKVTDVNDVSGKIIPVNLVQEVVNPKPEFMDEQQHIATLQVEGEEGVLDTTNAICMVDENGMILQKMEQAEDGTYYMQVMDGDSTKQVLSVNEDGTIQMVEVMWDEIGGQAVSEDDNMPF